MELDANEQIGTSEDSKGDESESRGFYVVLEYFGRPMPKRSGLEPVCSECLTW